MVHRLAVSDGSARPRSAEVTIVPGGDHDSRLDG